MKSCSTSLIIQEVPIKATIPLSRPLGWLLSNKQTNKKPRKKAGVGEDGETSEPWALVVGMWRTAWGPLKKSSADLSLDLPISLLYSKVEKAGPQDDNRAPGLMAALFTMARKQKQPGSPDR